MQDVAGSEFSTMNHQQNYPSNDYAGDPCTFRACSLGICRCRALYSLYFIRSFLGSSSFVGKLREEVVH